MKRRDFLTASCIAGLAPLGSIAAAKDSDGASKKEYYKLTLVSLASEARQKQVCDYLGKALIPALNRIDVGPIGVFRMADGDSADLYVLEPHKSVESAVGAMDRLAGDREYMEAVGELPPSDDEKSDPLFQRLESSLMLAFDGIPKVEVPSKKESRVFQLRIYESHNFERAKKKIAMFNEGGEIDIFRRSGMPPVFFGETLIGTKVPNLTYMLGFDDMEASKAGWKNFLADPAWDKLKKDPAYKDTVSNITNMFLRPAACSQI